MTRSEHIRALLEEYARQRLLNEEDADRRLREAVAIDPEIGRLREQSATLIPANARRIISQTDEEKRRALAEQVKAMGRDINARIRQRLKAAGLAEDALEVRYRCPVCRDTGYVGEAPARFCDCFQQRLRLRMHEDGSRASPLEQCFERFDPALAPEEDGQRKNLVVAEDVCRVYADSFPDVQHPNLMLLGEGGLGKTFLLNCIFARVTERGHAAVRVTAFRLFEAMRRQHMGGDEREEGFCSLLEAPLLLIDDLGTEPLMRNVTVEYLFMLLNERITQRRHTVIATNLAPAKLKERYGERVASRLLDRSLWTIVQMKGKDLRRL